MFGIWDWRDIKRNFRFFWQRRTRGWDDSETWNLDYHIAKFTLPRLKRFKEIEITHPRDLTEAEWCEVLDDMIYSMEISVKESYTIVEADWGRVQRGHELFGKYFRDLWW